MDATTIVFGDSAADLSITLTGSTALTATDVLGVSQPPSVAADAATFTLSLHLMCLV